ncbi:hypothetical protein MRX96_009137 [Rhipicephalus microplus]
MQKHPARDAAPLLSAAPFSARLLIVGTVRRIFGPCASTSRVECRRLCRKGDPWITRLGRTEEPVESRDHII